MFFVWILQKSQRFFAWVLQKRQPSHIKRMTAFFDNSIKQQKMLYFLISSGNTGMAPFCVQT